MKKNIKLLKTIILLSILILTDAKAELNNKVIITVGSEIITNYDLAREMKYLSVITIGQFKNLSNKESEKIAVDSLIKDKIKINVLANYDEMFMTDEIINSEIGRSVRKLGFRSMEDFKTYLLYEN